MATHSVFLLNLILVFICCRDLRIYFLPSAHPLSKLFPQPLILQHKHKMEIETGFQLFQTPKDIFIKTTLHLIGNYSVQ